ncbi:hypothetical protein [Streptomyces sp. NPDC059398]|uniref:hypothetical protein n=1 Tax=Streptomyces sp. NPDC059398 TaxID=3346820 RepID=UPI0036C15BFD
MDMQTWRYGRALARDAAEAVRAALATLGIPEAGGSEIRPALVYHGQVFAHVGMVPADVVGPMDEAMKVTETSAY